MTGRRSGSARSSRTRPWIRCRPGRSPSIRTSTSRWPAAAARAGAPIGVRAARAAAQGGPPRARGRELLSRAASERRGAVTGRPRRRRAGWRRDDGRGRAAAAEGPGAPPARGPPVGVPQGHRARAEAARGGRDRGRDRGRALRRARLLRPALGHLGARAHPRAGRGDRRRVLAAPRGARARRPARARPRDDRPPARARRGRRPARRGRGPLRGLRGPEALLGRAHPAPRRHRRGAARRGGGAGGRLRPRRDPARRRGRGRGGRPRVACSGGPSRPSGSPWTSTA